MHEKQENRYQESFMDLSNGKTASKSYLYFEAGHRLRAENLNKTAMNVNDGGIC